MNRGFGATRNRRYGSKKNQFSVDEEFILIQAVKNRPLLWDVTNNLYRRNDLKNTHWEEVATEVGSSFTGEMVKERFNNMRTNFSRIRRKVMACKTKCSGSGTDDIYHPTWPLYDHLIFLNKSCTQTDSVSNLDTNGITTPPSCSPIPSTSDNSADKSVNVYFDDGLNKWVLIPADTAGTPQEMDLVPEPEINKPASPLPPVTNQNNDMESIPSTSACRSSTPSSTTRSSQSCASESSLFVEKRSCEDDPFRKRGSSKKLNALEKAAEALVKMSSQDIPPPPPPIPPMPIQPVAPDLFEHFGLFVAGRLREMSAEKASKCQMEIVQLLCRD